MATYTGSRTAAYQQQSILTAPPERLVVMLYDGCLRFLNQAAYAMREDNRARPTPACGVPRRSSTSSRRTLDHKRGGEIAGRLQGIYVFCRRHLLDARRANDADMVDKVAELLAELRDAWAEIADRPGRVNGWAALVPLAERECELLAAQRWDDAAALGAERARRAQELGAPPPEARARSSSGCSSSRPR